jgi:hypothetical protein
MKHANSPWLLRASTVVLALLIHPAGAAAQLVVGPGPGGTPTVYLMEGSTTRTVDVFDTAFLGGVSVTLADVNGDGTADIIGAAGPGGGPHVRVLSGVDFSELASFFAYDPAFTGGVNVAAGDVDGDGRADIITGAGLGAGPHVQVFRGGDLQVLASFFAYDPAFTGGVSVAAGDVNGDGGSDIVTGAGPGGGPHVEVFSGTDLSVLESFWGYDPAFGGGVLVATGDINGDGRVDLILGAGPGGGPHVRIFSGVDLTELASFFSPGNGSGVSVGSVGDGAGLRFTSSDTTSFTAGSPGSFTITTARCPRASRSPTTATARPSSRAHRVRRRAGPIR